MLKIKVKEVLIALMAITLLALVIVTPSNATPIENLNDTNNTYNNVPIVNNTNTNVNNTNTNVNNTNTNLTANVNNTNTNNTTGLPKTGLETTSIFVIMLFGAVSIYTYKKIKEYNNI